MTKKPRKPGKNVKPALKNSLYVGNKFYEITATHKQTENNSIKIYHTCLRKSRLWSTWNHKHVCPYYDQPGIMFFIIMIEYDQPNFLMGSQPDFSFVRIWKANAISFIIQSFLSQLCKYSRADQKCKVFNRWYDTNKNKTLTVQLGAVRMTQIIHRMELILMFEKNWSSVYSLV